MLKLIYMDGAINDSPRREVEVDDHCEMPLTGMPFQITAIIQPSADMPQGMVEGYLMPEKMRYPVHMILARWVDE